MTEPHGRVRRGHDAISLRNRRAISPAQAFALTAGLLLVLIGALGFLESSSFDTDGVSADLTDGRAGVQGDEFLGFLVNGWHNIVHLATGALLLAGALTRTSARWTVLAFGLVYGAVTAWGFIDTEDVLGVIPVNTADNVLHAALTGLALLAAAVSFVTDRDRDEVRSVEGTTGRRMETHPVASADRDGRFGRTPANEIDPLTGRPRDEATDRPARD